MNIEKYIIDFTLKWFVNSHSWRRRKIFMRPIMGCFFKNEPHIKISYATNPSSEGMDYYFELVNFEQMKIKTVKWWLYGLEKECITIESDYFKPAYTYNLDFKTLICKLEIIDHNAKVMRRIFKI